MELFFFFFFPLSKRRSSFHFRQRKAISFFSFFLSFTNHCFSYGIKAYVSGNRYIGVSLLCSLCAWLRERRRERESIDSLSSLCVWKHSEFSALGQPTELRSGGVSPLHLLPHPSIPLSWSQELLPPPGSHQQVPDWLEETRGHHQLGGFW